jgi:hypothetical protein
MRRAAVFAFVTVVASMVFLLAPQAAQAGNVGVGVLVWFPPPPVIVVRPPAVVYGPPAVYGPQPYGHSYYGHAPRYYRDQGYERHRHTDWRHRDWRHNRGRDVPPPPHGGSWRRKHGGWND